MNETSLMMRYGMRHPFDMVTKTTLALKLLKRGRLELKRDKIKNPEKLRTLMTPIPERNKK